MPETQPLYRYLSFNDDSPYRRYIQVKQPLTENSSLPGKPSIPATKAHGSYGAVLLHPKWKSKRKEILLRDTHRCAHCKSSKNLQVHHRQYHFVVSQQQFRLPWDYPDHLLITLCESCHNSGHNKYKVPTINV